jgi:pSer/pThr/pTyr-binding forkhead associated (FHA) protein
MKCQTCSIEISHCPCCGKNLDSTSSICSKSAKLLLIDKDIPVFFQLNKEISLVGKKDASKDFLPDINLTYLDRENTISRYHANIYNKNGEFYVEDLVSSNGTFLFDGETLIRLEPKQLYLIKDRNRIRFGKTLMQLVLD